jgi:tetratricopeptide (TPR) repeat protein
MLEKARVVAIGLAAGLATLAVHGDSGAQPAPDYAHAKQLYDAATAEYDKGEWSDAERDFSAAYEITKDPVLFFKIGEAYEKDGKCEIALSYYGRYVREAKPAEAFVYLTKNRVEACGGNFADMSSGSASELAVGSGSGSDVGSDAGSGSAEVVTGLGSGSAVVEKPKSRDLPWLMVGGALAFATAGAVLAYSASSSEQDIKDLYVGLDGKTPVFDTKTQQRYQELLDEGHRYQYLSWGAFGVAAGFGIAATLIFIHDHVVEERRVMITPTATPTSAGAAITVHF